jgi:hypothetical protein
MVRKGKVSYDGEALEKPRTREFFEWLSKNPPMLVNITDHAQTWSDDECNFTMNAMDATPSYRHMWFEWLLNDGQRNAALVCRSPMDILGRVPTIDTPYPDGPPKDARFLLQMNFLHDDDGYAVLRAATTFCIDHLGCLAGPTSWSAASEDQGVAANYTLMICDVLTTMNTQGTRIEPPLDAKPVQVVKPNRAPCSVWHTIHLPKMPSIPLNAETSETILERREHWVRAHRRDYRHGAGMFGRVKALVWVPEFQRGNPELGSVKQTYKVTAR